MPKWNRNRESGKAFDTYLMLPTDSDLLETDGALKIIKSLTGYAAIKVSPVGDLPAGVSLIIVYSMDFDDTAFVVSAANIANTELDTPTGSAMRNVVILNGNDTIDLVSQKTRFKTVAIRANGGAYTGKVRVEVTT